MRQTYFRTLLAAETERVFPFIKKMNDSGKRRLGIMLFGALISPVILWRAKFQFRLPYLELVLTPRCNLRCEGCSNLMPLYTQGNNAHITPEMLHRTLDTLFSVSKKISTLTLIGGEPFLYPHLSEIVAHALDGRRVKQLKITTNGGIVPKGENLECLKDKRVFVSISEYPSIDRTPMIRALEENGIRYEVNHFDEWYDYGGVEKRELTPAELRLSFSGCASAKCKTLLNGKLYACPRAAHGHANGSIPCPDRDYVEILNTPRSELQGKIIELYGRESITACDYCNPPWARGAIEPGLQILPRA